MYTQCPECRTIFEIDEEALQASLGIVHCGKCAQRFDALRSLSDTLPAGPDATLGDSDAEPRVLTLTTEVTASRQPPAARRQRRRATSPAADAAPATATPAQEQPPAATPGPERDGTAGAPGAIDLTAELIAAARGNDADTADADWLSTQATPVQARFTELDIIPLTADELAAIEADRSDHSSRPATLPPARVDGDPDRVAQDLAGAAPGQGAIGQPQQAPTVPAGPDAPSPEPDTLLAPDDGAATRPADLPADAAPADTAAPSHLYVRPRAHWYAQAGLWWALGCCALALTLAVQLAWAERAQLVRNPQARPWVAQVCSNLPCHLPLIRDVAALELVSRDIRPDPNTRGALVITATLRNNATFRQPWPIVTVELGDIDGNPVAMRRFRPAEYMPDPVRRNAGVAPGATVAVAFEVADPGKRAVNFQFGFE